LLTILKAGKPKGIMPASGKGLVLLLLMVEKQKSSGKLQKRTSLYNHPLWRQLTCLQEEGIHLSSWPNYILKVPPSNAALMEPNFTISLRRNKPHSNHRTSAI
jgi:hypothetical protein